MLDGGLVIGTENGGEQARMAGESGGELLGIYGYIDCLRHVWERGQTQIVGRLSGGSVLNMCKNGHPFWDLPLTTFQSYCCTSIHQENGHQLPNQDNTI